MRGEFRVEALLRYALAISSAEIKEGGKHLPLRGKDEHVLMKAPKMIRRLYVLAESLVEEKALTNESHAIIRRLIVVVWKSHNTLCMLEQKDVFLRKNWRLVVRMKRKKNH